ncbi:hypothetical protein K227x_43100 [Rubripirellula lacrimiformis]|uniref:Uncharacterized protein n=1 Tax=Rubripirellula lacrimiformis TaxID=1930273 RepID=A0A517NFL6_9BACT|nr:hypothetical protein [Rubripirellula lacrimiformis]QDT05905.1 hypothetical protein K227x_43100 [Rubripirellula lacrimiformis]
MSRFSTALSLISALVSGSVYDSANAAPVRTSPSNVPLVQSIDTEDEAHRIKMDARIQLGTELGRK